MIFSHWHFCHTLKMTPQDTSDYLEFLFTLEEKAGTWGKKNAALAWLDKQDAPLLQVYAIPQLVKGILTANNEIQGGLNAEQECWRIFLQKSKRLISGLLENGKQTPQTRAYLDLIQKIDEKELSELVADTLNIPYMEPEREYQFSYLESEECVYSILMLSILCTIAEMEPQIVSEAIAEINPQFIDMALEEKLGFLSWKLAITLRCFCGMSFDTVEKCFPKCWPGSVECMEIAAYFMLEKLKTKGKSKEDIVRYLIKESYTLDFFEKYRSRIPSEELWMDEKANMQDCYRICAVLWQNILWNMAFEYDSTACADQLRVLWNAPVYGKIKKTRKKRLRDFLIPFGARVEDTGQCLEYYFCTPWQKRTKKKTQLQEDGKPFQEFMGMLYNATALRVFEAAILLRRIMESMTEFPVEYCRILLNMGEVFQCEDVNRELLGEQKYWESPVRLLGYFSNRCISMLGHGELNEKVPEKIIRFLKDGRRKKKNNLILNEQCKITGIQVCVRWAVESLRAGSILQERKIQGPWFSSKQKLGAAQQLCNWLFEEGIDLKSFDYNDPVLLCRQAFPEEYRRIINKADFDSWFKKYNESDEKITFCDIMLSGELLIEEWESLGKLKRERFEKRIWLSVLTLRLIAIAKSNRIQEYENWYTEWKDGIAAYASAEESEGVLFYLLIELLEIKFLEVNESSDYLQLILLVVGTIHSYTDEKTIFYQYFLMDCLMRSWGNYGKRTGAKVISENLAEMHSKRNVEKESKLLAYSLARIKAEMPHTMLKSIGQDLKEHWRQQCITGRNYTVVDMEQEEWNPLTDFVMQENQGKFSVMRPALNIKRSFKNGTKNLFKNPVGADSEGWYVGIVANDADFRKEGEKTYFIHYGTGRKEQCTANGRYQKGEIVGVCLNKAGVPDKLGKLAWKDDGRPVMVEILHFSSEYICLCLPNKEKVYISERNNKRREFHMLLGFWEPDTSRILLEKPGELSEDQKKKEVEVYYDKALEFYVPIERDFCRLVIEQIYTKNQDILNIRLVFIQKIKRNEEQFYLFNVSRGINYLISESDWEKESLEKLKDKLEEGNYRQGLIVTVCLWQADGQLELRLSEECPFDDKNWEWENYFSEDDFFIIHQKETDNDKEWYTEINVPHMPRQIKAVISGFYNYSNQTVCNVQLSQGGWDICHQRHGCVEVEPLRDMNLKKEWCSLEGFKMLRELKPGDILKLENSRLRKQRDGYHLMMTESNLPVFCSAESLSLNSENENIADEMISGRACVVELAELKAANMEAEYEAIEIPELEGEGNSVEGLISQFPVELNTPDVNNDKMSLGVWLNTGETIISVIVPASAFESRPKTVGAPVVANRREDGKWLFCSKFRRIQVRALWKVEDYKKGTMEETSGIFLGNSINVQGYGQRFVTQDSERPVLYLWEKNAVWKGEKGVICGIELGKGTVTKVRRRNFSWKDFPYAQKKDLVKLSADGKEYYGDSDWGEFDENERGANWSVRVAVYLLKNQDGISYYDMRRYFYSKNVKLASETKEHSEEQKKRLDELYEKWINEGDYHVIGAKLGEDQFQIKDLKVPQKIGKETLRDKWTDRVSMLEGDQTWVQGRGRYYPKNRVRALLVKLDDVWVASCHEALPFFVNDDLALEFGAYGGNVITKRLYYAGIDENNYIRFEWGYGFTFLVSEEDLVDEDGNKIGNNLFYGDTIAYFRMLNDRGEFGWRICVEYRAIIRQIEGRIWDDSRGENGIIQLLEIRCKDGDVKVERVSVTERIIRQEAGIFNSWDFHEVPGVKLEKESVRALLDEEESDEGGTRIIFARLKPERDSKRMTCLTFTYIPLDGKRGDTWLLEGQVVCMVAGEIEPVGQNGGRQNNKLGNDYKIPFYLPRELPHENSYPQICVSVLRREFSVDESKLRTLYSENRKRYYGCKMIVRLTSINVLNNKRNEWKGNVINTPKRARESLNEWIVSQEHCLVTLGKEKGKPPLAEVAPGIISYLSPNAVQETFVQGTLATLWMEEGNQKTRTILSGDQGYLPDSGRPAELLILDGTAKNYVKLQQELVSPGNLLSEDYKKTDEELNRSHFTVAGLPQILVADREFLEQKISEPIPRIAYLSVDQKKGSGQDMVIQIQEKKLFYAARLFLNQNGEPELHYFYPEEQVKAVRWGDISFMDGTVSELAAFVKRGRWHYHDRKAAFYDHVKHSLEAKPLPDGNKYYEIILFPNEKGNLRYQEKEFLKYGFPPREIIENKLPKQGGEYPVAGVTEESIWIEVFPGKLLEIPIGYLFSAGKKVPLLGLWTKIFSSGDRLCLWQDEGFGGSQRKLILKEVVFGSRAGFGKRMTFFPIKEVLSDGLALGTDLWPITLPVKGTEEWSGERFVCIVKGNKISHLRHEQTFTSGDVLLASFNKYGLYVAGWGNLKLRMAYRDLWKNAEWLFEDLLDRNRKGWMEEYEFSLPVEINNVDDTDKEMLAWVFYRQPDTKFLPVGTKICCICAGARRGEEGRIEMVVRAGRTLLSIPIQHILPGIKKEEVNSVVKTLKKERISFWIHKEDNGWYGGLYKTIEEEQPEIHMLFCVDGAAGIIGLILKNQMLRWIPAQKLARVKRVAIDVLWNALSERKQRIARRLDNGTLSLIETWQNEQKYEVLKTDGTRYRARPMEHVRTDKKGIHCYLAELYPMGDLICLYSEAKYDCVKREPIPIGIGKKQDGCVTAFPYGMRRRTLHLTPWVYKGLSAASEIDSSGRFDELNLHSFQDKIPERFAIYGQMLEKADQDIEKGQLDYEFLRDYKRTSEQLIYLYRIVSKRRGGDVSFRDVYEFIRLTLKAWLEEKGRFLISGLDLKERNRYTGEIDVVPTIAAILLLDLIKGDREDRRLEEAAKPLSVHLTRMLGIICGNSIHQEILLKLWILGNKNNQGWWLRLNQLSLQGEELMEQASEFFDGQLTPRQIRRLLGICDSLRLHTFWDEDLELVVECILLSIGALEDCNGFCKKIWRKFYITEKLATLGRILTPSVGSDIAGNHLDKMDIRLLNSLLWKALQKGNAPLSLVTDIRIPISDMVKMRGINLCESFCRLVEDRGRGFTYRKRE